MRLTAAMESVVKNMAAAKISEKLASDPIGKIEISKKLIGSYCWGKKGKMYMPGYPSVLKKNYMHWGVGKLKEGIAGPEIGHTNEYWHSIYYEPVQEVLESNGKSLRDYHILTDRHNILKMDAALQKDPNQEDYAIFLQKKGNLMMLKREDSLFNTSLVGHEFEKELCEPYDFESCHMIVEYLVNIPDRPAIRMIVRGEVDAIVNTGTYFKPQDYGRKSKLTKTGLKVYSNPSLPVIPVKFIREIKMARELKESHHFQSWLLGVPITVHGINKRTETRTKDIGDFNGRLAGVVQEFLSYADKMEDMKIYRLFFKRNGTFDFSESQHPKVWLNFESLEQQGESAKSDSETEKEKEHEKEKEKESGQVKTTTSTSKN